MKIGELSQRSGVSPSAIRFYEASGLMPEAERGSNGYRSYDEKALRRLLQIQLAQRLGFSLDVLRQLFVATSEGVPHEVVMQGLAQRLTEIKAMQKSLAAQRAETEALMRRLQADWEAGRCLNLGVQAESAPAA